MKVDQRFGLVLLACSCLLIFYLIPTQIKGSEARLFPYITAIVTGLLSLGLIFNKNKDNDSPGFAEIIHNKETIWHLLASVASFFVYYFLVEYFGFYIPSLLLLMLLLYLFGTRAWVWNIAFPFIFCVGIYFLTTKLLAFQMPLSRYWYF